NFIDNFTGAQQSAVTATETGTYTLTVGGLSGQTGAYQFKIWDVPATTYTTPITLSQPVTGSITIPGQQIGYTFNATAGQQLWFDSQSNGCIVNWAVTTPSGAL